jgi:predicted  nucleic acid-binding Zn-ribbon protein
MDRVIGSYFDEADRGLSRMQAGGSGGSSSQVQLPPLRSPDGADDPAKTGLGKSSSMGALGFTQEQLTNGVHAERYQQTLRENAKLSRRNRQMQEQLSITSAKKEAFKAQAQRLEKEFKKTRDQSDTLQKELFEARQDAGHCSKEAQEAMTMMTEMRKAHIHEVRLLQRGLAARSGEGSRNKVDEFADLVDKVGRAVVQRDESIRDRAKMQAQLSKSQQECRSLTGEVAKLRKQNAQLQDGLQEARRKAKFKPPRPDNNAARGDLDDSDDEFEHELSTFEKRMTILEEGPAGLDILASNLSKDKQLLEKRIRQQQETMKMLNQSIDDWKAVNRDKDEQIAELRQKIDKMLQDQAILNEQIAQKRREMELQVEEEKAALETRISQLQGEVDLAQSQSEGLEKVSSRLTKELVKVHGQYGTLESQPSAAVDAAPTDDGLLLAKEDNYVAKTGETLRMEVRKSPIGAIELIARELPDGQEVRIPVEKAVQAELDDEWPILFSRVGVSLGPPKQIVISTKLEEREIHLPPSDAAVILTAYKYDARRFFFSGVQVDTQAVIDHSVMEDALTDELCRKVDACGDNAALFELITAGLSLTADRAGLSFSASAALNAT